MENEKICLNGLPSSKGSTYELLQGAIWLGIMACVFRLLRDFDILSAGTAIIWDSIMLLGSGICWFFFIYHFANGCKNLKSNIPVLFKAIAYLTLIVTLIGAVGRPFGVYFKLIWLLATIGSIASISGIIIIVLWFKVGARIKNTYNGLLGALGHNIVRVWTYGIIFFVISISLIIVGSVVGGITGIISFVLILGLGAWLIVISYSMVFEIMVELLEEGFFSQHTDIA